MTAVPSPCISLCQMDTPTGLCTGCWRTLDEIVQWGAMNAQSKQQVWALLDQRRLQVVFKPPPVRSSPQRS